MCVDVRPDHKCHKVEERHPGLFGQELLGECERDWGSDPRHLHHRHEACANGSADLVKGACARNDGHGSQVDSILDGGDLLTIYQYSTQFLIGFFAYHKVRDEDLRNLRFERCAVAEQPLENSNQGMAERSADQGAISHHLRDARGEVVAMLAAVMSEPGGQDFLDTSQGTGREHFGAEGVCLELFEVGLPCMC